MGKSTNFLWPWLQCRKVWMFVDQAGYGYRNGIWNPWNLTSGPRGLAGFSFFRHVLGRKSWASLVDATEDADVAGQSGRDKISWDNERTRSCISLYNYIYNLIYIYIIISSYIILYPWASIKHGWKFCQKFDDFPSDRKPTPRIRRHATMVPRLSTWLPSRVMCLGDRWNGHPVEPGFSTRNIRSCGGSTALLLQIWSWNGGIMNLQD